MYKKICSYILFLLLLITVSAQSQKVLSQPFFSASRILYSLQKAYPQAIRDLEYKGGEWFFSLNEESYIWAEGRLLPLELQDQITDFSPYPFYSYSDDYTPPLPDYSEEQKKELESIITFRVENPVNRYPGFNNTLYGIYHKQSALELMEKIRFLGHPLMIHRDITGKVSQIEKRLKELMLQDPGLSAYISSIKELGGFNWRQINGTMTLSNHSYGIAIDVVPVSYEGKEVYWQWYRKRYDDWYSLPWENRCIPPESFIRAFEEEGFIWGGKWLFFDGIHFEYRPEILLLNEKR